MKLEASSNTQKLKFDLVIAGGGGAGLAAAAAAVENGVKNIAILEKRGVVGGTSAMASGIFAAESPAQKRQAILADKDVLYRRMLDWTHLSVNPRILRAYINKSADTIRWLEDKGLHFNCVPHSPIDNPLTWHVPKGNGAEITGALAQECKSSGVNIFLRTAISKLVRGPQGNITGVIARQGENDILFSAHAVVIATGGFAGDKELMKKLCPKYRDNMRLSGQPNMGEGIFSALEAGAAPDGLGMIMIGGPLAGGGPPIKLGEGTDSIHIHVGFISGEPSAIWVNKEGKRFIDETASFNYYECINVVIRQPENTVFAVFDTALVRKVATTGLGNVPSGFEYGERQRGPLPPGLEEELQVRAEKGELKIADSWEPIADWFGVDRQTLRTTIDEYNSACDVGYDAVFGKDRAYLQPLRTPPYYGVKCGTTYLNTLGGIKINEHMEVIDTQGIPIRGLYASGVDTGGWTSDTYCAALPGTAFGYAINSGRIAGESAAAFISGVK
ncbi:MAG: FAD-dependent oxidoreductase [Dehalococcoidales bacterium]|jgi:fumarate reductase flavoprotein subunit